LVIDTLDIGDGPPPVEPAEDDADDEAQPAVATAASTADAERTAIMVDRALWRGRNDADVT
jgi:hypothetical protein